MSGQSTKESASAAAQVALIALRSQVIDPDGIQQYLLPGHTESVTEDSAISELAGREKPMRCHATAIGSVLAIECERLTNSEVIQNQLEFAQTAAQYLRDEVKRIWGETINDPVIMFEGTGDGTAVRLRDVIAFVRDYDTQGSFVVTTKTKSVLPAGVHIALKASQSRGFRATIEVLNSPP